MTDHDREDGTARPDATPADSGGDAPVNNLPAGVVIVRTRNATIRAADPATRRAASELFEDSIDADSPATTESEPPDEQPAADYDLDYKNPYHLQWAYERAGGSIGRTADYFSVSKTTVRDYLTEAGIHDPDDVNGGAPYRDEDTLCDVFVGNDRDVTATAEAFGVAEKTIRNWLNRFDISSDPGYQDPDRLTEVFEQNDEMVDPTAAAFDASPTTIRRWLRRFDLLDERPQDEPAKDDVEDDSPSKEIPCADPGCGKTFDTERGMKIHYGQVHGDDEDDADELVDKRKRWCGHCGAGPMTGRGVRAHTSQVHGDVDPEVRDEPPVLEDDETDDPDRELADPPEDMPEFTDYDGSDDPPGSLKGLDFEVPERVTPDAVRSAVESGRCDTILDVAQELQWRNTGRLRTVLHRLDLYDDLPNPEAFDEEDKMLASI